MIDEKNKYNELKQKLLEDICNYEKDDIIMALCTCFAYVIYSKFEGSNIDELLEKCADEIKSKLSRMIKFWEEHQKKIVDGVYIP